MIFNSGLAVDIAITSYCNLHCPYCFANNMLKDMEAQNISLETLQQIFDWMAPTLEHRHLRLGIIGGEPTLHPNLENIIKLFQSNIKEFPNIAQSIFFTNGINLEPYIDLLQDFIVLININSPIFMTDFQYKKIQSVLEIIAQKNLFQSGNYSIGVNLFPELDDYQFIWDIVDKYNIPAIRFSICAPSAQHQKDKEIYYLSMKNKLLEFYKEAYKRNIVLVTDCNQLPLCYYTPQELEFIKQINIFPSLDLISICEPTIDISPAFTASCCFGQSSGLKQETFDRIDCRLFDNLEQLNFYLLHKRLMPRFLNNGTGRCASCQNFELLKCQGGCLAFSSLN